jgi:hypothetical protein
MKKKSRVRMRKGCCQAGKARKDGFAASGNSPTRDGALIASLKRLPQEPFLGAALTLATGMIEVERYSPEGILLIVCFVFISLSLEIPNSMKDG